MAGQYLGRSVPLLLLLSLGLPRGAEGQRGSNPVAVFALQPLDFGSMVPGESVVVGTGDPLRRAELEVSGAGRRMVIVTLPDALRSPSGAVLPLVFASADGRYVLRKSQKGTAFDPRVPTEVMIPPGQDGLQLFLGGSARAAPTQPAGRLRRNDQRAPREHRELKNDSTAEPLRDDFDANSLPFPPQPARQIYGARQTRRAVSIPGASRPTR